MGPNLTGVLVRRGNLDTDTHWEDHVRTQGEDDHLQAKERGSEETSPANTLILDL